MYLTVCTPRIDYLNNSLTIFMAKVRNFHLEVCEKQQWWFFNISIIHLKVSEQWHCLTLDWYFKAPLIKWLSNSLQRLQIWTRKQFYIQSEILKFSLRIFEVNNYNKNQESLSNLNVSSFQMWSLFPCLIKIENKSFL